MSEKYIYKLGNGIGFEDHINDLPFSYAEISIMEKIEINNIFDRIDFSHLNKEEAESIKTLLYNFKNLFYKEGDILSATAEISHDRPIYSKIYRHPQVHEKEIKTQIKQMLQQNIIKDSNSPYNSPLWIVPKKIDNSNIKKWRLVVDYRKLNEYTISDKFSIPKISVILDKLGTAQYFTTIDLAKGFHQIIVREEDREKTAFSTPYGHYEFARMPFGLKNAPSTFQRLMNSVVAWSIEGMKRHHLQIGKR